MTNTFLLSDFKYLSNLFNSVQVTISNIHYNMDLSTYNDFLKYTEYVKNYTKSTNTIYKLVIANGSPFATQFIKTIVLPDDMKHHLFYKFSSGNCWWLVMVSDNINVVNEYLSKYYYSNDTTFVINSNTYNYKDRYFEKHPSLYVL